MHVFPLNFTQSL